MQHEILQGAEMLEITSIIIARQCSACDVIYDCQIIFGSYNVKEAHVSLLVCTLEFLISAVKPVSLLLYKVSAIKYYKLSSIYMKPTSQRIMKIFLFDTTLLKKNRVVI